MALIKYKLGDLICQSTEKNASQSCGVDDVRGVSVHKVYISTKANMNGVSLKNYLLIKPKYFTYVPVTSRNGEKISICYNDSQDTFICSATYICFYVNRTDILDENYLFMYFNRTEFDRYSRFNSWGSARETFGWDELCNIEIELPPLEIQKKYVAVYNAMVANQKSYEKRLDDLKMTCEAYIEELRKENKCQCVGDYIELVKELNSDKKIDNVVGLYGNSFKQDGRKTSRDDISKYQIIREGCICYPPPHFGNVGTIGLYRCEKPALISPMYVTIKSSNTTILLPQYLMLWLGRKEFKRYAGFHSDGSIRDTFDYNELSRFKVPIPEIKIQESIVSVYDASHKREELNRLLQRELQQICPILIKGAMEEAQKQL